MTGWGFLRRLFCSAVWWGFLCKQQSEQKVADTLPLRSCYPGWKQTGVGAWEQPTCGSCLQRSHSKLRGAGQV